VIPVKREFKDAIQSVVHDQSDSGMTLFVEPTRVIDLNNRLQILQSDEKKEISRILLYLTDLIAKAAPDVEKSLNVAGTSTSVWPRDVCLDRGMASSRR